MKKLFNILALSAVVLSVSCDMDKKPQNAIDPKDAFNSVSTIEALELGAYARLKDNYGISNTIVADIQADYVNAISGFLNTYGDNYYWTFQRNNDVVTDVWQTCYLSINQCNFILAGIAEAIADDRLGFDADTQRRLELVKGRCYLIRALSYSTLAERFCAAYDKATASKEFSGVPWIDEYDPDKKPGRATLEEIYGHIKQDIAEAKSRLQSQPGSANAIFLNRDCVTALEARVALQTGDYKTAYDAATSLTGSSAYALVADAKALRDMWVYDRSDEIIFKFAASKTEIPTAFGTPMYMDQQSGTNDSGSNSGAPKHAWQPDYVPTQEVIDLFDAADWRFGVYFKNTGKMSEREYALAGSRAVPDGYTMVSKFSGNPDYRTTDAWNYANTWKVFRLAEMYLIAAEAAAMDNSVGDAAAPLNALRKQRGLAELSTVGLKEVKEERRRELLMEGFRLTDLKRWGDEMKRGESQFVAFYRVDYISNQYVLDKEDFLSVEVARDLNVTADDYRFVWPIPEDEIFANQVLQSQQNPGWER